MNFRIYERLRVLTAQATHSQTYRHVCVWSGGQQCGWPTSTRARCSAEFLCVPCPATWLQSVRPSRRWAVPSVRGCWTSSVVSTSTSVSTVVSVLRTISSAPTVSSRLLYTMTTKRHCCPAARLSGFQLINVLFHSIYCFHASANSQSQSVKALWFPATRPAVRPLTPILRYTISL